MAKKPKKVKAQGAMLLHAPTQSVGAYECLRMHTVTVLHPPLQSLQTQAGPMTARIGQIAVHNTAPSRTRLIELEDPSGPTSEYSTLAEMLLLAGGIGFEPTTQIIGATAANIAEVEATKAMRMTLRDDAAVIKDWCVNRYQAAIGQLAAASMSLTTVGPGDTGIVGMYWLPTNHGLCVMQRITACLATGALTGARAGSCKLELQKWTSDTIATLGTPTQILPHIGAAVPSQLGLLGSQSMPQLSIQYGQTVTSIAGTNTVAEAQSIGTIIGGSRNVASTTHFMNETLYDQRDSNYQPLVLAPGWGLGIRLTAPAAATSQSLVYSFTLRWDEWVPSPQNDR